MPSCRQIEWSEEREYGPYRIRPYGVLRLHGCLSEERQQGQKFFVDLTMQLDLRAAGEQDDLGQTVNYADVFTKIRGIVEGEPCQLIEAVAERIASWCWREYPRVQCSM